MPSSNEGGTIPEPKFNDDLVALLIAQGKYGDAHDYLDRYAERVNWWIEQKKESLRV